MYTALLTQSPSQTRSETQDCTAVAEIIIKILLIWTQKWQQVLQHSSIFGAMKKCVYMNISCNIRLITDLGGWG